MSARQHSHRGAPSSGRHDDSLPLLPGSSRTHPQPREPGPDGLAAELNPHEPELNPHKVLAGPVVSDAPIWL
jgi:hypothetical protein